MTEPNADPTLGVLRDHQREQVAAIVRDAISRGITEEDVAVAFGRMVANTTEQLGQAPDRPTLTQMALSAIRHSVRIAQESGATLDEIARAFEEEERS